MNDRYLLVAETTSGLYPRVVLDDYASYPEAVAAFEAANTEKASYPHVRYYAVRTVADPGWGHAPRAESVRYAVREAFDRHATSTAVRAALHLELGYAARWAVEKGARENLRFGTVVSLVTQSLRDRGWTVAHRSPCTFLAHDVEQAVKSRVLLGRCRPDRWGNGCDLAFWFPKNEGPLHTVRCPHCRERLCQTTLSLKRGFARLPVDTAAVA